VEVLAHVESELLLRQARLRLEIERVAIAPARKWRKQRTEEINATARFSSALRPAFSPFSKFSQSIARTSCNPPGPSLVSGWTEEGVLPCAACRVCMA
jgi:hypothetical protein